MAKQLEEPVGFFAEALQSKMDELGLDGNKVADMTGASYEHIRKLAKGESTACSKYFLPVLCRALKLDVKEMNRLLTADRIRRKYGTAPLELVGKKPDMEPLERVWDNLTHDQKGDLIAQAQAWSKRNKVEGRR